MSKLWTERPMEKREAVEEACYDVLGELAVPFVRVDHEAVMTCDTAKVPEEALGLLLCKNLFLHNKNKSQYYLFMIPGDKKLVSREASKLIHETRLSFGSAEKMMELLGVTPGSVSVFGLMNDQNNQVKLLIAKELLEDEYLGVHPCRNTSSLKIRTKDLIEKILPFLGYSYTIVDGGLCDES